MKVRGRAVDLLFWLGIKWTLYIFIIGISLLTLPNVAGLYVRHAVDEISFRPEYSCISSSCWNPLAGRLDLN